MELTAKPILLLFVGLYFLILIYFGISARKKIDTSEDFILAGKALSGLILAGTLAATWVGSGTITGSTTVIGSQNGFKAGLLISIPVTLGVLILMLIAPKVREAGCYTISELIERRYGEFARALAALVIIGAYLGICAYQFKGIALVLNVTTGLNIEVGTLIGLALIIFLAASGGLNSVAKSDAFSAIIIVGGLVIGIPAMISVGGGWKNITEIAGPVKSTWSGGLPPLTLLNLILPTVFLMLGDQNMFQRMAASSGDKELRKGLIGMMIGVGIIAPAVALLAFISGTVFTDINPSMSFLAVTTVLPTVIGGLVLAAATGIIITTGNSFLLSVSTNMTYDVYAKYINKEATDEQKLKFTKIIIVVFGIIAYVLLRFFPTILAIQMYSYTIYGAGLTPAVLGAVMWKKATKQAGIASMITGSVVTIMWEIVLGKPFGLASAIISIPAAIIVLIVVGTLTYRAGKGIDSLSQNTVK